MKRFAVHFDKTGHPSVSVKFCLHTSNNLLQLVVL